MTNCECVLALICSEPTGLTDSEIRERTGIRPHQQVNRICRNLAQAGLIVRRAGSRGRLVNIPSRSPPGDVRSVPRRVPRAKPRKPARAHSRRSDASGIPPMSMSSTLVILPCSGKKRRDGRAKGARGTSVLQSLPDDLATKLKRRRADNAPRAKLDETALLPAAQRYSGTLYRAAGDSLDVFAAAGAGLLIISGGYGVVLPTEPIGWYEQKYGNAMWPEDLVARSLEAYADAIGATSVVAFLSRTTQYATIFRAARWPERVEHVLHVWPESTNGAMIKVPRALGEGLKAFSRNHALPPGWASSDGLSMQTTRLR